MPQTLLEVLPSRKRSEVLLQPVLETMLKVLPTVAKLLRSKVQLLCHLLLLNWKSKVCKGLEVNGFRLFWLVQLLMMLLLRPERFKNNAMLSLFMRSIIERLLKAKEDLLLKFSKIGRIIKIWTTFLHVSEVEALHQV